MLTGWMMKKCCEKYRASTLFRMKLDTMDVAGENTKLGLERHHIEINEKGTPKNKLHREREERERGERVLISFSNHGRICSDKCH